jgi:hypothetical protein
MYCGSVQVLQLYSEFTARCLISAFLDVALRPARLEIKAARLAPLGAADAAVLERLSAEPHAAGPRERRAWPPAARGAMDVRRIDYRQSNSGRRGWMPQRELHGHTGEMATVMIDTM